MEPVADTTSESVGPNVPLFSSGIDPNLPLDPASEPPNCAPSCSDLPDGARAVPGDEKCRTNPPMKPLSDAQWAAIHMTVAGMGSKAVARRLRMNHHTIGRWKRDPRFTDEVLRLRQRAAELAVAHAAAVVGAPPAPGAAAERPRGGNREVDAMFARVKARVAAPRLGRSSPRRAHCGSSAAPYIADWHSLRGCACHLGTQHGIDDAIKKIQDPHPPFEGQD